VNDENKRGQGREVLPDLFPEIDGFILGLTPEQLKDSSLEDARREENFRFADQLLAGALAGDEAAIELDRLAREEFEGGAFRSLGRAFDAAKRFTVKFFKLKR
jgi:hypothetical protein